MATLTVQEINLTGLIDPATAGADAGLADVFANDGRTIFYVENNGAVTLNITFNSVHLSDYGTDENVAWQILAGEVGYLGPFDPSRFNNSLAQVEVSYDQVASVVVLPFKVHARGW